MEFVPQETTFSQMLIERILGSVLTLYMLALLLRWLGPYIELTFERGPLAHLARMTDPLVQGIRKLLPPTGSFDWSPIAAIIAVWVVRIVLVGY